MFRIRLIPATISTALLLLCVKVIDISHTAEALAQQAATPTAEKPADKKSDAKPDETKKAEEKVAEAKKATEKKAEDDKKAEDEKNSKLNPNVAASSGDIVEHRFTPVELDLLQNLVRRREELDHWEKNVEIKEEALSATEKRVDEKITQIDNMKKEVASLLAQYNEKEDGKIRSLVKIYQGMKPKDAARIFDELDMPVLLLVVDKMPEKNTAPILALMDPKKAKQITVQLAEQRKMGSTRNADSLLAPTAAPVPAAAPAPPAAPTTAAPASK